jgi:ribosomal protein S18 acetylase RimI-like enzyme
MTGAAIERVQHPSDDVVRELAVLTADAVRSGAGVSFMSDDVEAISQWWRGVFRAADRRAVILAARDAAGVVGTVQLQPAWPPNQPHRGDVAKLIVHTRARGRGIARALMLELERIGREQGFTLLLLDTCKGSAAERLYDSMGWTRVGEVPRFALNPDGSWCDTVFFYKQL